MSMRALSGLMLVVAALSVAAPRPLAAQRADPSGLASYYRAVGEHFRVPPAEILILSEWRLPAEEIPVVLWMAGRAGISPDAVVALRRAGRDWSEVASRYRLDASDFHLPLEGNPGSLGRAYDAYRTRSPAEWPSIALDDGEIVSLVNLRVLSEILRSPPAALLQTRDRSGSWVDAFSALSRR
jgi:hypothetical protein